MQNKKNTKNVVSPESTFINFSNDEHVKLIDDTAEKIERARKEKQDDV